MEQHTTNRRDFVHNFSLAIAGSAILPCLISGQPQDIKGTDEIKDSSGGNDGTNNFFAAESTA